MHNRRCNRSTHFELVSNQQEHKLLTIGERPYVVTRGKDRGLNEEMVLLTTKALRNMSKVKMRCSFQLLTVSKVMHVE